MSRLLRQGFVARYEGLLLFVLGVAEKSLPRLRQDVRAVFVHANTRLPALLQVFRGGTYAAYQKVAEQMTGNDYLTIAASTRIRLARNVSGYPFPCMIGDTPTEKQLVDRLLSVFVKTGEFDIFRINELSETQKRSLVERYLISKNLAKSRGSAVAVS